MWVSFGIPQEACGPASICTVLDTPDRLDQPPCSITFLRTLPDAHVDHLDYAGNSGGRRNLPRTCAGVHRQRSGQILVFSADEVQKENKAPLGIPDHCAFPPRPCKFCLVSGQFNRVDSPVLHSPPHPSPSSPPFQLVARGCRMEENIMGCRNHYSCPGSIYAPCSSLARIALYCLRQSVTTPLFPETMATFGEDINMHYCSALSRIHR
jgi:hypothetical protein